MSAAATDDASFMTHIQPRCCIHNHLPKIRLCMYESLLVSELAMSELVKD